MPDIQYGTVSLNQNFLEYYKGGKRNLPFDPYLVLLSAFENTLSKQIRTAVRECFNSLTKHEYFSKNEFSFKIDLFEVCNMKLNQSE